MAKLLRNRHDSAHSAANESNLSIELDGKINQYLQSMEAGRKSCDDKFTFRIAENIKRCLELELYFYSRIFGFIPADPIEPIQIQNLDD